LNGMPAVSHGTIIRNNVFSKAANASRGADARPNVLVGHFPLQGAGVDDWYFIYGNLFYANATEALFQGEGNIAIYNNLFINPHGDAVNIRPHNDLPRRVRVFFNTVVASGTGISLRGQVRPNGWDVSANAVFAARNALDWLKGDPLTSAYMNADKFLANPFSPLGQLDPYPLAGKLAEYSNMRRFADFPDWDRDFNGLPRMQAYRGAYAGSGRNPGGPLRLERKPLVATSR